MRVIRCKKDQIIWVLLELLYKRSGSSKLPVLEDQLVVLDFMITEDNGFLTVHQRETIRLHTMCATNGPKYRLMKDEVRDWVQSGNRMYVNTLSDEIHEICKVEEFNNPYF